MLALARVGVLVKMRAVEEQSSWPSLGTSAGPIQNDADASLVSLVHKSPFDVAGSYPKGRILQSLVPDDEPLRRLLRDASLSAAGSDPTSRALTRRSARPPRARIKHPSHRGFRDPRPIALRWRTDCRPCPGNHPACVQRKGQASRQATRRRRQLKFLETLAVRRYAQRRRGETRCRSLSMTAEARLLMTNDPR